MIVIIILLIVLFSFLLIKSSDLVVLAVRWIAKDFRTTAFTISALVLALGTSLPELFVAITSAVEKFPNLSLGVVIGSNIANIALIGGLSAIFSGRVLVHGEFLRRDVWISFVAGLLPFILIADETLGRADGLILLSLYLVYVAGFFKRRLGEIEREQKESGFVFRFIRRFNHLNLRKGRELAKLFAGIVLLLFSAEVIVKLSSNLAKQANLPIFLVGLLVIALGTSLPELAFSIRALTDHEPSMFFGNILGSTIVNSTLVVGLTAVIYPIEVNELNQYLISALAFIGIFLSFWFFIRTKHRLDRWEAMLLLILYLTFFVVE